MKRGFFITVEGGEGVGKSTQTAILRDAFAAAGKKVHVTREPGGSPIAESIRKLLLAPDSQFAGDGMAELLLMFAARAEHLEQLIKPALKAGEWVVCDRFTDASYAYQGGGRGVDTQQIQVLENMVQAGLNPDWTLLLDAPVETGLARVAARGGLDRFEQQERKFYERVRAVYLDRAKLFPDRFRVIDASGSITEVGEQVALFAESVIKAANET